MRLSVCNVVNTYHTCSGGAFSVWRHGGGHHTGGSRWGVCAVYGFRSLLLRYDDSVWLYAYTRRDRMYEVHLFVGMKIVCRCALLFPC